ncbi:GPO family capsid scaffolding protein [Hydrogenophaga sp.]|uniref:GPO family capsid scaffolding protein n=1 Tax=Hydrogenophaga sp. TaxID=1904254 RepID=UPI003F70AE8A
MAKISKFFRVAVEGATTDGRTIDRAQIEQMGRNYNRQKYGARVWLEHYRGVHPESTFRAYGDVLATKAEEIEIDGKKKLALFAQIEPLEDLVAMTNKARQKIFTSIEITPKFADSGEAYLTGLGVTDSPASLGTEVLQFAQQKPDASPFASRKSNADALFSEAVEVELVFEDAAPTEDPAVRKFSDRLKAIVNTFTGKAKTDDARFAQLLEGFEAMGEAMQEQVQQQARLHAATEKANNTLRTEFDSLNTRFNDLVKKLECTPGHQHQQRPHATGATGIELTDC